MTIATQNAPVANAPVAPAAPTPGSPEYDAAMIAKANAKVEGTPAGEPEKIVPPAETLILGKFKDAAALEAAYVELEKKQGAPKAPDAAPSDDNKSNLKAPENTGEVADVLTKAGLKMEDLSASFTKDGALTADQYAKLAAVGIPKPLVDSYIEGQVARGVTFTNKVYAAVGGEESFKAVLAHATVNASKEALAEYNAAIDAGDMTRISNSLATFQAAYKNANPTMVGGSNANAVSGFRSDAEMVAAMQDPRYQKDPAYRQDVYNKVAAMKRAA